MEVYPVVHINSIATAAEQATNALDLGADGVYLIDHRGQDGTALLYRTFDELAAKRPEAYVGLNLLGYRPLEALQEFELAHESGEIIRIPDGLWADDASLEFERGETMAYKAAMPAFDNLRYLGGVAFKYTCDFTEDPAQAARAVQEYAPLVDVVTTSGEGTGKPPTVAKIAAMKRAAGTLAVASGISIANITDYAGLVDQVLVASSVETKPYSGVFDLDVIKQFIDAAHRL